MSEPLSVSEQETRYVKMLQQWNRHFNLTAIDREDDIRVLHINDSLSVLPYCQGNRVLDVGCGAGLPGIPLAIHARERHYVLLEASQKKCCFLRQVVNDLQLSHVCVVCARVEQYHPEAPFNTIVSRAVTSVAQLVAWTKGLLAPGGRIVIMKGGVPEEELNSYGGVYQIASLPVAGFTGERHVVIIEQASLS